MHTESINVDLEAYRTKADMSWSELSRQTGISREMLRRNWTHPEEFKWGQLHKIQTVLAIPASEMRVA